MVSRFVVSGAASAEVSRVLANLLIRIAEESNQRINQPFISLERSGHNRVEADLGHLILK